MDLQHLDLKLPLAQPAAPDFGALIPVFHRWVREQRCEELLIDVVDYRHVPAGPGVILIGHEASYSLDATDHRPGLRYARKARVEGGTRAALAQGLLALGRARAWLEQDPELGGALHFNRCELELRVNDRLLAPNRPETFQALRGELTAFFTGTLGLDDVELEHHSDPREVFRVTVRAAAPLDAVAGATFEGP